MAGRVVVLGSINVDLLARVARLPRAGETIAAHGLTRQLGGKGANQAVAAARADAPTILLGAVGEDAEGETMCGKLAAHGVDVGGIARLPGATGQALVVTSDADNQIIIVGGANALVQPNLLDGHNVRADDVCLAQMETPSGTTATFFERARAVGATTVLNAAPASDAVLPLLPLVDVLIVNEHELEQLGGRTVGKGADDADLASVLSAQVFSSVPAVIVTLGEQGAAISRAGDLQRVSGVPVCVVDTTGAGDCFCGYVAAGLAHGASLDMCVAEANVAAAIAVQSLGAASSIPARSDVLPIVAST